MNNSNCDFGTNCGGREVGKLPISEGSNVFVCKKHFKKEMLFRITRNTALNRQAFKIENWNDLKMKQ